MTDHMSDYVMAMVRYVVCAALALVLAPGASPVPPTATAQWQHQDMATLSPTAPMSPDLAGEQWWTTTDCPPLVEVPCLDPAAEGAGPLPEPVWDELQRLSEEQWVCLDRLGLPWSATVHDGVRVSDEVLVLCRQFAYLAVAQDRHPGSR